MPLPTEEPRISLNQAAARYPGSRGAERTHPATLTRWILRGCRSVTGQLVKLEAERVGCRWLTSEAALARFAERLAGNADAMPVESPRTPTQRQRASDRAARELERMGA